MTQRVSKLSKGGSQTCSLGDLATTRRNSVILKVLGRNPTIGKNLYSTLQVLIKELRRSPIEKREPLEHYAAEQMVQTSTEICYCIERRTLDIFDIKDMTENLMRMLERILKLAPAVGIPFALDIRKFILLIQEMATSLQEEERAKVCPIDWLALAEILMLRVQTVAMKERNIFDYVPKVHQLSPLRLVGAGGFGSVFKALFVPSETLICVKLVPEDRLPAVNFAVADKLVASIINSPFLIQYLCVFQAQGAYVTMMEYVPGVDLNRICHFTLTLPADVLRFSVLQMFLGIEHLHLKGFVHRDIKLQNVLITCTGHLKVIDFDTNKLCLSHFVKNRPLNAFFKRTAKEFRDSEIAGTLPYMAPETFKSYPYGRALDWWALGVTIYRLHVGHLPFRASTEEELRVKVLQEKPDWTTVPNPNAEVIDLGTRLLRKNPKSRLGSGGSYREIRLHPFFKGIDIQNFHKEAVLCEVPFIREAMNPADPSKGATSPQASKGAKARVALEIRNLKDARGNAMKRILTFASPGFMKLMDHIRTLKAREKVSALFSNPRKLYGLGTLSSELNYEWDSHDPKAYNTLASLEAIIGTKRFKLVRLKADRRKCLGLYAYDIDLREVHGAGGPCAFVYDIRGARSKQSGLLVGDIIFDIAGVKVSEGMTLIRKIMRERPQVDVCVFSINAFRLAKQGVDVHTAFACVGNVDLRVTSRVKQVFKIVRAFEMFTEIVAFKTNTGKPLQVHMVSEVHEKLVVKFPPDESLYVGDVLLAVNGASAAVIGSPDAITEAISKVNSTEITITVLPISPLRYAEYDPLRPSQL